MTLQQAIKHSAEYLASSTEEIIRCLHLVFKIDIGLDGTQHILCQPRIGGVIPIVEGLSLQDLRNELVLGNGGPHTNELPVHGQPVEIDPATKVLDLGAGLGENEIQWLVTLTNTSGQRLFIQKLATDPETDAYTA